MNYVIPQPSIVINHESEKLSYSPSPVLSFRESASETLHVPHIQDRVSLVGGGNRKILDTRELSHVDLAIDNKAFQVYPEPKKKSSGRGIWPRDE